MPGSSELLSGSNNDNFSVTPKGGTKRSEYNAKLASWLFFSSKSHFFL